MKSEIFFFVLVKREVSDLMLAVLLNSYRISKILVVKSSPKQISLETFVLI